MILRPVRLSLLLLAVLTGCADAERATMVNRIPEEPAPVAASTPPPVAEVMPPVEVVPVPPPARFAGHVASYKTLAEAEAAWPRLADRFPVLKSVDRRYVEIDLGGQRGKVVRLLVGGFPDRAEALSYCRNLRGSALYCAPHELPTG